MIVDIKSNDDEVIMTIDFDDKSAIDVIDAVVGVKKKELAQPSSTGFREAVH